MKQRLIIFSKIALFLVCVSIFIFLAIQTVNSRLLNINFQAAVTAESTKIIDNPYRGFYHLYGYTLTDETSLEVRKWSDNIIKQDSRQLILLQINMRNFSNEDLSSNALKQLNVLLEKFTSANKQLILRFIYDWDGKAVETEPATIGQLGRHMEQVCEVVNKYKSHVFILQGIGTGNCGEMTGTNYSDEDELQYLMETIAKASDPTIFLAVRTPAHLRGIVRTFVPLAYATPYSDVLAARLGLFNDGMLGSVYDLGTYDDTSFEGVTDYLEAGTRKEELAYQNQLCKYVPNGGEVTLDNVYNDIENAVTDLNTMHITYLNRDHDLNVMKKWANSTYDGVNGLQYIEAHLGYRYVLTDAYIEFDSFLSTQAFLHFTIKNSGFAPAYRQFDSEIILENTSTGQQQTFKITLDNRSIQSGQTATISLQLPVRTFEHGTYNIYLSMKDPSTSLPIQFANEDSGETTKLGILTVN